MFKFIINIPVYQSHFYDGLIDLLKAGPWRMYYMYNWNFLIFISVTNLLLFANVAAFLAVHLWFEEKHLKIILFLFLLQYMKLQIIMLCSVLRALVIFWNIVLKQEPSNFSLEPNYFTEAKKGQDVRFCF